MKIVPGKSFIVKGDRRFSVLKVYNTKILVEGYPAYYEPEEFISRGYKIITFG